MEAVLDDLERRKQVRLRLRPDLVFSPQKHEGRTCYVVKDPITLRYCRFTEPERFLLDLLDGRHTLAEAQKAFEERFRPQRLTLEELELFASELLETGLLQNESPQAGRLLLDRARTRRRRMLLQRFLNVLAIRVPLFEPDRLLARLLPPVRFVFTPWFLGLVLLAFASALVLLLGRWDDFIGRLPGAREFFSPATLLYLWLALAFIKVLHEFGHGLCCKAVGGEVHEMGVLLLVFAPCLYCRVSDAWTLPSKWQRIAISAAGVYVELMIATAAAFLWWLTGPGAALHNGCLIVMVICSVQTLVFNANPLLRLDGYFVLSDWLEIPNLRDRADQALREMTLEHLLGVEVPRDPDEPLSRRLGLAGFAVASYLYRWLVTWAIVCSLYAFLSPRKLGALGFLFGAAALAAMLGWPVYRLVRSVRRRGRLPEMKPLRVWLLVGTAAAVLLVLGTVPLPMRVTGLALIQVEPGQARTVSVPDSGGYLRDVLVRDGQRVRTGDVLAVLSNPDLEVSRRLNEADQTLRRQQQQALTAEVVAGGGGPSGRASEGFQETTFALRSLAEEQQKLTRQAEQLTLRAPCDGVVLDLRPVEERGKWLEPNSPLCRIGNDHALRAVLLVDPSDRSLVQPQSRAWVRVHGGGSRSWPGVVTEIAQVEAGDIPPQLSNRLGGEVAARHDPVTGTDKPRNQHFLVAVHLEETAEVIQPGVLGRVKIEVPARSLAWRCRRYLAATFRGGF